MLYAMIGLMMLSGCFSKIDEKSIIGRYDFSTQHSDILDLYKDHTYIHRYTNTTGEIFDCHGTWRYNGRSVAFQDFCFFNDKGASGGQGIWDSTVALNNGKIELIYANEDNVGFFKN